MAAHPGRQPVARWYFPPEVDYRLSLLHPDAKGLIVWVYEAKVLSKAELQFLAMLPDLRPKVRGDRGMRQLVRKSPPKPLKQISGLEPGLTPRNEEHRPAGSSLVSSRLTLHFSFFFCVLLKEDNDVHTYTFDIWAQLIPQDNHQSCNTFQTYTYPTNQIIYASS
ncbi:hypothetical protein ZWY2020_025339 [Hordeum vulgare]|nr:hypothetical protein ZWY2020_025339 [Hordeum vulgare]